MYEEPVEDTGAQPAVATGHSGYGDGDQPAVATGKVTLSVPGIQQVGPLEKSPGGVIIPAGGMDAPQPPPPPRTTDPAAIIAAAAAAGPPPPADK